jgi:signal transduction histidine kinase
MSSPESASDLSQPLNFLAGGGELGEFIRGHDWASTPLGMPQTWPQSLKTAVRIMLTSRQPIWIGWGEDLINLYNDAYRSIIGGRHPWAIGKPAREVWKEIWSQIGPMLDTAMGGVEGTYVEEDLLIMERNGYPEETYYTYSYSPIPDDDGTPGGIICANTDDTQRVQTERQLAVLRDLGSKTVDARTWREACQRSCVALATNPRDITFAMLYARPNAGDTLELVGCLGLASPDDSALAVIHTRADTLWHVAEVIETRKPQHLATIPAALRDNLLEGIWGRMSSSLAVVPIVSQREGARDGVLIVGLNPYRLFDRSYQEFLTHVAAQISDAIDSADAYEQELRRIEALDELHRAKNTFFSNVSHEFRTPLTLMLGPLEEILNQPLSSEQISTNVSIAHRNGLRLLRLVNSLLDFSRIEAGRVRARYEPTDLSCFSFELASIFRSAIERAQLKLELIHEPLPKPVYVDHDMWEKILLNLLSNAYKFTLEGQIQVTIKPSPDHASAMIVVRDTGVGIPESELPHLFERFHRISGQKSRSIEGSGIGLALVNELVKLHAGSVVCESGLGAGTAITVTLPFGRAHLPEDQVFEAIRPDETVALRAKEYVDEALRWTSEAQTSDTAFLATLPQESASNDATISPRKRILLADDNADMRDYIERLFKGSSWDIETVADGQAALEAIRSNPPALVLTDVMMPRLDGFGLLRAIRGDDAFKELPVIILSARAGEEARVEGLDAGADDYLTKPFTARELLARIKSNLDLAQIRSEAMAAIREREERLRDLNLDLENRVVEEVGKRAKAEEALRHAQKMEAVGQLTGGIAHDFNNLLTVIIGGLESIQRSRPDDEARRKRAVELAFKGAQRAANLTSRLLAFSRRQPLEPKRLDVNLLVRDMSDLLHRTLGEQIELEGVLSSRLWHIEADKGQLENAIINLAVNARDAMPDGGKLIIETSNAELDEAYAMSDAELLPGQYVCIAVSDTGQGMDKETLSRAFEPFYTTKEVGRGTGLGLSMIYGFVKQSGGHISLSSEAGTGTEVKLYFPRCVTQPESIQTIDDPRIPRSGDGEVVLVVEDNDDVRAYSVMTLAELGYHVLEAADANEAFGILHGTARIDLLFTDVVLPGKSGRVIADEAVQCRPGLKVLFATGYSRDAIVHHGRLDPGVNLITKPFTFEQLAVKVREVIDEP